MPIKSNIHRKSFILLKFFISGVYQKNSFIDIKFSFFYIFSPVFTKKIIMANEKTHFGEGMVIYGDKGRKAREGDIYCEVIGADDELYTDKLGTMPIETIDQMEALDSNMVDFIRINGPDGSAILEGGNGFKLFVCEEINEKANDVLDLDGYGLRQKEFAESLFEVIKDGLSCTMTSPKLAEKLRRLMEPERLEGACWFRVGTDLKQAMTDKGFGFDTKGILHIDIATDDIGPLKEQNAISQKSARAGREKFITDGLLRTKKLVDEHLKTLPAAARSYYFEKSGEKTEEVYAVSRIVMEDDDIVVYLGRE